MARTTAAPAPQLPFNQIINVQWPSGLAVEFFDGANGAPQPAPENAENERDANG